MVMRRLTPWFARLLLPLVARFGRRTVGRTEPVAVAHGRMDGFVQHGPDHATGLVSGRWLDDARRLRSHRTRHPSADARWSAHASGRHGPLAAGDERFSALFSHQQPAHDAPDSRGSPAVEPRPVQQSPIQSASLPRGEEEGGVEPDMPGEQHRLQSLRRLVRLGIYNEGFAVNGVPEQYRYSLGLDCAGGQD